MSKTITKIELDGNVIGSKPFLSNEALSSIRNKVKERINNNNFKFLDNDGNYIDETDENDFTLKDIILEKRIKLISTSKEDSNPINIYINDNLFCSKNFSQSCHLDEIRKALSKEIKGNFIFLDQDELEIEKQDEEDFSIEDILKNDSIKLKSNEKIEPEKTPSSRPEKVSQKKTNTSTKKENSKLVSDPKPAPLAQATYNLSEYEEFKSTEFEPQNIKLYKYSNIQGIQSRDKNVFEYFVDKFDVNDYRDAYIVLFCGKSGDGKSTAINAFFNIVKGIKLEDNFRFILISEEIRGGGQHASQTKGVHIYYLKDYENKPIIILDSQGYGDTGGINEDHKITEAFTYVFTEKIQHINAACFISKATTNRLDTLTKYIFSSVTGLFAEDISENFIILATFANSETIKKGPAFITSINKDNDFLNIQKRMDKDHYWFAFDSKTLFEDEINERLTKYSYDQFFKLYEEKIKRLFPKETKKSGEVLKTRNELKIQVNRLKIQFKELLVTQDNLKNKENIIIQQNNQIKDLEHKIRSIEEKKNQLKPEQYEKELRKLNNELDKNLNDLSHKKRIEKKKELKADSNNQYTRCDECKENCHNPCDCWFSFTTRCKIYPCISNACEKCGHNKKVHRQEYYHYVYVDVEVSENTDSERNDLKNKNEEERKKIQQRIDEQNNETNSLARQINELKYNKEDLQEEKNKNILEKNKIESEENRIKKELDIIITKLQILTEKINCLAMNTNYAKNQNDYIDSLEWQMKEIGYKNTDIQSKLKELKNENNIIEKMKKIPQDELLSSSGSDLIRKYKLDESLK